MATVAFVYFEWLNASPGGDVLQLLQLMPQLMEILTRLDGESSLSLYHTNRMQPRCIDLLHTLSPSRIKTLHHACCHDEIKGTQDLKIYSLSYKLGQLQCT